MSSELSTARAARRTLLQAVHSKQSSMAGLLSQLVELNLQLGRVAED